MPNSYKTERDNDTADERCVSDVLAELTGRPASAFQPSSDLEMPHPSELESVDDAD